MKNSDLFFLFFTLPAVGAILLSVWVFPWVPRLRFYSLIPYAFLGGFAIHLYSNIRSHRLVEGLAESKHVHVSMGINGVVGILAAAWTFIAAIYLRKVGKEPLRSYYGDTTRIQMRCFYFFLIDLVTLACLITAAIFGFKFLPHDVRRCGSLTESQVRLFSAIGNSIKETPEGGCRRAFAVEILDIVTIILVGFQCLLLAKYVVLPPPLRATVFFIIRIAQKATTIFTFFGRLGSRLLGKRSQSLPTELKSCCTAKAKRECWACTKSICNDCRVLKKGIRIPRTTRHAENCYSICTKCYLFRSNIDAAPLKSTWHSEKMALQHSSCFPSGYTNMLKDVELCPECAVLNDEEVTILREDKERLLIAQLTKRRLRCSTCDADLPKKRRRWWICESCTQECHWAGHRT